MTEEFIPPSDPLAGPGPQPEPQPSPAAHPALPNENRGVTAKLVLGIGIIFLGIALTLEQLHPGSMTIVMKLIFPAILISMGLVKLRQSREKFSGAGYWLVFGGAFLLLVEFSSENVEEVIPALLVIGLGVFIVMKALRQRRDGPSAAIRRTQGITDAWVSGTAIFGGFKRRVSSQAFQGGDVTAIFGGFEVDLLNAKAGPAPMVLDLFVLFGGGEIQVPEGWDVEVHATSIFGSVEQKQIRPYEPGPNRPKLLLSGTTLFGGVEIRH